MLATASGSISNGPANILLRDGDQGPSLPDLPALQDCKGIRFELAHTSKHVGEIDYLEEAHAPPG